MTEQTGRSPDTAADWMTVEEAARVLRISRGQAYLGARTGAIPTVKFGRLIRVSRHALDALGARSIDGFNRAA